MSRSDAADPHLARVRVKNESYASVDRKEKPARVMHWEVVDQQRARFHRFEFERFHFIQWWFHE